MNGVNVPSTVEAAVEIYQTLEAIPAEALL